MHIIVQGIRGCVKIKRMDFLRRTYGLKLLSLKTYMDIVS